MSVSDSVERTLYYVYLREGAVVPKVSLVGKAITDVAKLALLDILLDGVQCLFLRDLKDIHELAESIGELGWANGQHRA